MYHYAEPFLSEGDAETPEGGAWYARLRHERYLNAQQTVTGRASSPVLAPGEVLEPQGSGLPDSLKNGIVITGIHTSGARDKGFQLRFTGIPYNETVCYRPALLNRPVMAGSLPARVESDEKHDTYAYLDNQGRYRVRLDFDRNSTEQGYAYIWLRLAKPYAGDTYGFHSPLLDGTEVSVMFDSGDPDRPYIAHALHDSEHPDHVTHDNHTRNVWRTAGTINFAWKISVRKSISSWQHPTEKRSLTAVMWWTLSVSHAVPALNCAPMSSGAARRKRYVPDRRCADSGTGQNAGHGAGD